LDVELIIIALRTRNEIGYEGKPQVSSTVGQPREPPRGPGKKRAAVLAWAGGGGSALSSPPINRESGKIEEEPTDLIQAITSTGGGVKLKTGRYGLAGRKKKIKTGGFRRAYARWGSVGGLPKGVRKNARSLQQRTFEKKDEISPVRKPPSMALFLKWSLCKRTSIGKRQLLTLECGKLKASVIRKSKNR